MLSRHTVTTHHCPISTASTSCRSGPLAIPIPPEHAIGGVTFDGTYDMAKKKSAVASELESPRRSHTLTCDNEVSFIIEPNSPGWPGPFKLVWSSALFASQSRHCLVFEQNSALTRRPVTTRDGGENAHHYHQKRAGIPVERCRDDDRHPTPRGAKKMVAVFDGRYFPFSTSLSAEVEHPLVPIPGKG